MVSAEKTEHISPFYLFRFISWPTHDNQTELDHKIALTYFTAPSPTVITKPFLRIKIQVLSLTNYKKSLSYTKTKLDKD